MKSINAIKIIVVNLMSETSLRRVYIVGEVERFRVGVGGRSVWVFWVCFDFGFFFLLHLSM